MDDMVENTNITSRRFLQGFILKANRFDLRFDEEILREK